MMAEREIFSLGQAEKALKSALRARFASSRLFVQLPRLRCCGRITDRALFGRSTKGLRAPIPNHEDNAAYERIPA